jgi:hypothetical protein
MDPDGSHTKQQTFDNRVRDGVCNNITISRTIPCEPTNHKAIQRQRDHTIAAILLVIFGVLLPIFFVIGITGSDSDNRKSILVPTKPKFVNILTIVVSSCIGIYYSLQTEKTSWFQKTRFYDGIIAFCYTLLFSYADGQITYLLKTPDKNVLVRNLFGGFRWIQWLATIIISGISICRVANPEWYDTIYDNPSVRKPLYTGLATLLFLATYVNMIKYNLDVSQILNILSSVIFTCITIYFIIKAIDPEYFKYDQNCKNSTFKTTILLTVILISILITAKRVFSSDDPQAMKVLTYASMLSQITIAALFFVKIKKPDTDTNSSINIILAGMAFFSTIMAFTRAVFPSP